MDYTQQREDLIWNVDSDGDEYQNVLHVLNEDFRTFGESVTALMQKKASHEIERPIEYLRECCEHTGVPLEDIGSAGTLRNWFSGRIRPKKGEDSREKMFALAFALRLSIPETSELFHKAYLDRAFNQRNYRELIYYFCIGRGLSYADAKNLIAQVHLGAGNESDMTVRTQQIAADADQMVRAEELLQYIHTHEHNFMLNNHSARIEAEKLKKRAQACAQECAGLLSRRDYYHSKDIHSDSFLYAFMTNQQINGKGRSGTGTIPIANTHLPEEIRKNFPQVKSLALNMDSFEEMRKVIILLFSYEYWYRVQNDGEVSETDIYDDYISQLDALLSETNLPLLYYGNPFDWLFMYCTATAQPLDTFQGILAEVLEEADAQ